MCRLLLWSIILSVRVMQASEWRVPVQGQSSGVGSRVPAASSVVVSDAADAAYHSHATAGLHHLWASGDNTRSLLSAGNDALPQRRAEGIYHVILSVTSDHRAVYSLIQIPYRLFESYVHHVATVNIPPIMAASSVISVKRCWWTVCGCKYIANKSCRSKTN